MTTLTSLDGLGIYVHFPWCLTKCPYCDFLSVAVPGDMPGVPLSAAAARPRLPHRIYADAVISELDARRARVASPGPVRSVFFGGGTPSLWDPEQLGRVLRHIGETFHLEEPLGTLEVTVECNPTSFDEDHGRALVDVGVTRVSLGVQGLEQERLTFLGRLHDPDGALRAVREALRARVPRVSADLIHGVTKQSPQDAVADVKKVLETGVTHVSAYTLTIEPGTRFGALAAGGKLPLLDEALVAASFEAVAETLSSAGFSHYEISNFARPGHESRHNLGYWLGRDYLGLGTGAFGALSLPGGRLRYKNLLVPERYVDEWTRPTPPPDPFVAPLAEREDLSTEVAAQEALLLGLRTSFGVDWAEFERVRGVAPKNRDRELARDRLVTRGRLRVDGQRWFIPHEHWLFADGIIRDLL